MGLVKPSDSFSVPSPTHCYRGRVGSGATGGDRRRKRAWWGRRYSGDDVGRKRARLVYSYGTRDTFAHLRCPHFL
ncbi:hypothetical protein Zm00014a_028547 [Zea mays]|uniref:Uncharacterized protein n=1 Tax=Zea mays TaxID=4577 RepID=A0A3L6G5T6_MAIZE|nr:hypothetical protein Zm00014a_028547 [Zea mays]